jgi:hypothetical protein
MMAAIARDDFRVFSDHERGQDHACRRAEFLGIPSVSADPRPGLTEMGVKVA